LQLGDTPMRWPRYSRVPSRGVADFFPQQLGFAVSNRTRDEIAGGDVIGMILAVSAILALHYRVQAAPLLVWVFAAATAVDLVNATIAGIREQLFAAASKPGPLAPTREGFVTS
jgi:hypothetical protein